MPGNGEFLVGLHNMHVLCGESQERKLRQNFLAHRFGVLANAAREDNRIKAADRPPPASPHSAPPDSNRR